MIKKAILFFKTLNKLKVRVLIVCLIFISTSVIYEFSFHTKFPTFQKRKDASGFSINKAKHFSYFHYYNNLFPLATLDTNLIYSKDGANYLINNRGENLIMEYEHWSRLGENARIFAFLPNSIIRGSPKKPSIKLFNHLVFTLCLIMCFLGFSYANKNTLGILLVFLTLITPYFWHEVYQSQNIFGILIPLFLGLIGLNSYFLFYPKTRVIPFILTPLLSGILIGFFSEIRGEIIILFGSLLLIYILGKNIKLAYKTIAIITLALSLFGTKKSIVSYFDYKFKEAYSIVKSKGGHVYDGNRINAHKFWHPIFCGLGDFDDKYNYKWNDRVAYKYAIPILKTKYGMNITYSGKLHLDEFYDDANVYYKKFDEIDEYEEVVKNKVLKDIKNDPIWYISILIKRINRVLIETLPFHWIGWLSLPFIFLLFKQKKWSYLKLIFIGLPLSFTPIFIYSGGFSTHNTVIGIIIIALIINLLLKRFCLRFTQFMSNKNHKTYN